MIEHRFDLRSDALTHPTDAMREAMARAEVGRYGDNDDPSVRELELRSAEMFQKEAAVFLPSVTMANLIACMHYCKPGEQAIVDADSHLYRNEFGGMARVGGIMPRAVSRAGAIPDVDEVADAIAYRYAAEHPVRLVWIENTHNVAGGAVASPDDQAQLRNATADHGIALHVDGARIFNAAVAQGVPAARLSEDVDSISVGFNKSLACPIGCVLVGSQDLIDAAIVLRRMFGGKFNQAGVLAAACTVALDTMVKRLEEDHATARMLGAAIEAIPGLKMVSPVVTNLVRFDTSELCSAPEFVQALREHGVWVGAQGTTYIRAVTHRHVAVTDIPEITSALELAVQTIQERTSPLTTRTARR